MKVFLLLMSLFLPLTEESEALKVRATALLELVLKGSPNKALVYVDDDSKDRFLELWGKGIPSYKIEDVRVNGDQAQVIAKIKHSLPNEFSIDISHQMDWVLKNGEWFLHVPDWDRTLTPFGRIMIPDTQPPPAPGTPGEVPKQ
jgi:hypothetical protein